MNLFSLPPGTDFAREFARGFWERFGDLRPEEIARIEILTNNRRALRVIEEALMETAAGSVLLPRLRVLAELGADPLLFPEIAPPVNGHARHLRLIRLVEAYLQAEDRERMAPVSAAPDLARDLTALLDEFDEAGLALDALDTATGGEHSEHWARTLHFIDIVRRAWPAIAEEEEGGALNPKARQRLVIEGLAAGWRQVPPTHPVIAVGSTGSVATTAELLAAISRLENGMVVFPGLDPATDAEIWEIVAAGAHPEHPLAPFQGVFSALGASLGDVARWRGTGEASARQRLLSQSLRPAPVTDAWQQAAPEIAGSLATALADVALIEASSPRAEAAAIAAVAREAIETPGQNVVVLAQDAALARRISVELGRFGIQPDDSMGLPLAESPVGIFLRLTLAVARDPGDVVSLAALIQHPLTAPGCPRTEHLRRGQRYEKTVLREREKLCVGPLLPGWEPEARTAEGDREWLARIELALSPLAEALTREAPLGELLAAHIKLAAHLSTPAEGDAPAAWRHASGEAARELMLRLATAAPAFGEGPVRDYENLLLALMRNEEIRPEAQTPHPRVRLISPREARMIRGDVTILAGLNEGGWPHLPRMDPWLSRQMRKALSLALPERGIGLSAHDFLQAASGGRIFLSRSLKVEGTPTVASRWLIRLKTLVEGIDESHLGAGLWQQALDRGAAYLGFAEFSHLPDTALAEALPKEGRPMPAPPLAARPRKLSVTTVEKLVRDPYAVYARHVLDLQELDPLGAEPDLRDRGNIFHKILEKFAEAVPGRIDETASQALLEIAAEVLSREISRPDLRRIWLARIARFADWFIAGEIRRRAEAPRIVPEIRGGMSLPTGHEIRARADRVDLLPGSEAAIYDYKAGAPPSVAQIKAGFNQQLHLQAAILAEGGFENLPPAIASTGAYIGLTGAKPGGKLTEIAELDEEVGAHIEKLEALLRAYDLPETGYTSRARVKTLDEKGDYDHLARFGEWEAADG